MPETRSARLVHCVGFGLFLLSAALWVITTTFFVGVWDQVAAVTTFPQWMWATAGILISAIAWLSLHHRSRLPIVLMILWVVTTICFADNLVPLMRALVHGVTPSAEAAPGTFRVISLNCATSPAAAQEVIRFRPHIVLLQESPTSNKVAQLAREWFGTNATFLVGWDCAIVSRYPLTPRGEITAAHFIRARLVLPNDRELLVTSLRLTPPLGSMDLWRPATWRAYAEDRRVRTQQLQAVLDSEAPKRGLPEIMAGDFNAPAGDGVYKLLHQYHDSHRTAGRGWGGTALNTIPIFRPDQIWLKRLGAAACYAVQTIHSDHRMVVVDLLWSKN